MGIGYILGCFFSIVLWKIDRKDIYEKINYVFKRIFKIKAIVYIINIALIFLLCLFIWQVKAKEFQNFITAFLVLDISNTENKNLKKREKIKFYDSISLITSAVLCGFIAPLFYIILLGNIYGIIYSLIYNISYLCNSFALNKIFSIISIIPGFFAQIFYYIIYVLKNKKLKVNFKGDYFKNSFINPMLNLDIMAAYFEGVNFYYHYTRKGTDYIKNYGDYKNKIDNSTIKDYLCNAYSICMISFTLFVLIKILQR